MVFDGDNWKKGRQLFWQEKNANSQTKLWLCLCLVLNFCRCFVTCFCGHRHCDWAMISFQMAFPVWIMCIIVLYMCSMDLVRSHRWSVAVVRWVVFFVHFPKALLMPCRCVCSFSGAHQCSVHTNTHEVSFVWTHTWYTQAFVTYFQQWWHEMT